MTKSGNKFLLEYLEIREREIFPALEEVKRELEEDGWYCFIGDLKSSHKIKGDKNKCLRGMALLHCQ